LRGGKDVHCGANVAGIGLMSGSSEIRLAMSDSHRDVFEFIALQFLNDRRR